MPNELNPKALLHQIQADAIDRNSDLSNLLRKCLVLAALIENEPLKTLARAELDGYPESSPVPDYRILRGLQNFGDLFGPYAQLTNARLSVSGLPEEVRDSYTNPQLRQGVRSIQAMISDEVAIRWAWPAEAIGAFDPGEFREDLRLVNAWTNVPTSMLEGVLDTIRNRVLNFVLEIDPLIPEPVGDNKANPPLKPDVSAHITQVFNQTFQGTVAQVGAVNIGSQMSVVIAGDVQSLKTSLREQGIPDEDLNDLEKAIVEDGPKPAGKAFGNSVATWIGNMTKKAGTGAVKIGIEALVGVGMKALKEYYGFPS